MPDFRAVAVQAARRNGIDPNIFLRQINQESGFNPAPSGRDKNGRLLANGSGAMGIAQIVPRWHPDVDASDPVASLNYAAHLMGTLVRKYDGSYAKALSVYNSGNPTAYERPGFAKGQTYNYVKTILGGSTPAAPQGVPGVRPLPLEPGASLTAAPLPAPRMGPNPFLAQALDAGNKLLGIDAIKFPTARPMPAPALAPGFAPPTGRMPALPAGAPSPPLVPKGRGKVVLSSTADRQGVGIKPAVLNFVSSIAGIYGQPLTVGTGTNHNQYVAGTHRQSDHWTGWAADIPSSGRALTKLGQDALIAAGANPQWARAQKGGLFNIGGKQIIFNSMEGGNHFNHLHVGIRTH